MNIVNHPLCTTSIGAPSDMQEGCSALPVAYHADENGTWAISFWKPTAAELAMLRADGGVKLQVRAAGRQHPVVAVGTYPALTATSAQIAASDDDPDMGRGVEVLDEIEWCINHGTADARVEACLLRCHEFVTSAEGARAGLVKAAQAAIAYDKAIAACANDPASMSSYCTAHGESLDMLYANWIGAAEEAMVVNSGAASTESHPDDIAIDVFAAAMKAKMAKGRADGRHGWHNKNECAEIRLRVMLRQHVSKGDPVDVGNFAMMLFNRGERTADPVSPEILAALAEARRTGALNAILPDGWAVFINRGDGGGTAQARSAIEEALHDLRAPKPSVDNEGAP